MLGLARPWMQKLISIDYSQTYQNVFVDFMWTCLAEGGASRPLEHDGRTHGRAAYMVSQLRCSQKEQIHRQLPRMYLLCRGSLLRDLLDRPILWAYSFSEQRAMTQGS